jgi:hypothetical protein
LKTERAANIGGGAAVLAAIAGNDRLPNLNGWYEAVDECGGGDLYAQEVFETLKSGASATIYTGESLQLASQGVEVPKIYAAQSSTDYGRAVWSPAYPGNASDRARGLREPAVDA